MKYIIIFGFSHEFPKQESVLLLDVKHLFSAHDETIPVVKNNRTFVDIAIDETIPKCSQ